MNKGTKPDEQQKLVSFRVDDFVMRKFEALKEQFSATGKKASTSDVARSLIEAATVQNGEFAELLANAHESIRDIRRLSQTSQPLRRAQWELVSYLVHDAYRSNHRQMVKSRYFNAALEAFAAWRRLTTKNDDRYFLANLRRTGSDDLLAAISTIVNSSSELVTNAEAEFGSRNFNVAMRDDIADLNALDLNAALLPYLPELLPAATRSVYIRTKKPLFERERDFLSPPIRPVKTDRYWLSINMSGASLTAALDLPTHRSIHPINSFLQFQELEQLLNEVTPENISASTEQYWLAGPGATQGDYLWRYYGHQMTLAPDEFQELRELFIRAMQQEDVRNAIGEMIAIYGDI